MAELNISSIQDLEKLKNWVIEDAAFVAPGPGEPGFIRLRISHPAAACEVDICIIPTVHFSIFGPVVTAHAGMFIRSVDVKEQRVA